MYENVAKSEFVNYLLNKKHGKELVSKPILEKHVDREHLGEIFCGFNSEFTGEELHKFIISVQEYLIKTDLNDVQKDLVFGILYSCTGFVKEVKKKGFRYKEISDFYKMQFDANKKYMMQYNAKDKGKISISAPKNVVTRFPPEASGYLHIGHVKAALLNYTMAHDGKMLLRYDDTNPEKEKKEYERAIVEDLKLLGIKDYKMVRSSDWFDKMYELAIQLIKDGLAYCDDTPQEQMREERMHGMASKNRNKTPEENLGIFMEMNKGSKPDFCLRAKMDYENKNKAMRDPVIYRWVGRTHIKTGNKYKIFPTYDFACPIIDSLDGVTLTLRTNEYRDRNPQYYWFIEKLHLKNVPKIHDFSRMNFENTVLSKRKIRFYVDEGYVSGWDDPRVATLRGIKRAGLDMNVLKEYILKQGASQKSSTISWDKLWAANKKAVDKIAARYMAVPAKDVVNVTVYNSNHEHIAVKLESVLKFNKNEQLGKKTLRKSNLILMAQEDAKLLEIGEEFTFMHWGNMIVKEMEKVGGIVKRIELIENLNGDFKTTKHKLTWISKKDAFKFDFVEYGNLQNDKETEDLAEKFNSESKKVEEWLGESDLEFIKAGEYIQIERVAFLICDAPGVFNMLPFTKQKRS
ncbi:SYEC [Enterospora canceri]|uniref:Probable glutamate--tRNA ligase, cytoplasmic n=1 Tax=Enterospora canceri TaxID=1081671 RepID=A0A1Y1S7M3_9MICR|nr:SYEC [Enterospora canceri]